jgi:hypothetical protein
LNIDSIVFINTGKSSTLIAIMNALGTDCTSDFFEIHQELGMWPKIQEQLRGFRIGHLLCSAGPRVEFRTWDTLVAMGRISAPTAPQCTLGGGEGGECPMAMLAL